jgi:hypothetical protein
MPRAAALAAGRQEEAGRQAGEEEGMGIDTYFLYIHYVHIYVYVYTYIKHKASKAKIRRRQDRPF